MAKQLKRYMVAEYDAAFGEADSILFVDYSSTTAHEMHELRIKAREHNLKVRVIKSTLASRALADKGVRGLTDVLGGHPAAAIFGSDGGAVRAAKLISEWKKAHKDRKVLDVCAGVLEGELAGPEAADWKDLPSREEMLSILLGQIVSVGGQLSSQLIAVGGALASQIEQKSEGAE